MSRRAVLSLFVPLLVWTLATWLFWTGHAGMDDLTYGRFAHSFHRIPIDWREFRMPAVLAIRGSFGLFGTSEFAAVLPCLLASLAAFGSAACFLSRSQSAWVLPAGLLLLATLPIDVAFRSYSMAPYMASGLLALGSAMMLLGRGTLPHAGSLLFAVAFMTHEMSFFYIAIFCVSAVAVRWKRYWRPVATCALASSALVLIECAAYYALTGNPFERVDSAVSGHDLGQAGQGLWSDYLGWPLRNLVFCSQFGSGLGLFVVFGGAAWKRFQEPERILYLVMFGFWLYLGYGTLVPWTYRPIFRQFHYYSVLGLGIAVLLPQALDLVFRRRSTLALGVVASALCLQLLSLGLSGRWDERAEVAKDLYHYALRHPDKTYLTDVNTMNMMVAEAGYELPANVICLNGEDVETHLKLNREPEGTPLVRFPERRIDGILINREIIDPSAPEFVEPGKAFRDVVARHDGPRAIVAPVTYRALFALLIPWIEPREFMILSLGGEVIEVPDG